MKFDYAIGNPPYQEMYNGESSGANSVYDKFIDAAYAVADKSVLIHPARFLFNAGSTPKTWNEKMLNSRHFKILSYESNTAKIFPNLSSPITGGVVISYQDKTKTYEKIGTFTPYEELNSLFRKVYDAPDFVSLSNVIVTSFAYHFTSKMHSDNPTAASMMSKGHANDLKSNVFERLPQIFYDEKPDDNNDYIQIYGRLGSDRVFKYIRRDYINDVVNLDKYKLFVSKADGAAGQIGMPIPARILGKATVIGKGVGSTESFLSIGAFETKIEAENAAKYVQSKFTRALLGVLKVTQDITPAKWKYVPLQDFTPNSDINWSTSIRDIDQQLYKKYGLSQQEIDFIESHVKEMA